MIVAIVNHVRAPRHWGHESPRQGSPAVSVCERRGGRGGEGAGEEQFVPAVVMPGQAGCPGLPLRCQGRQPALLGGLSKGICAADAEVSVCAALRSPV